MGIIKKKMPKATFVDFHSCGRFHSAFRRSFFVLRLVFQKEEGPRLPPGAKDPCHQPTVQEQINDNRSEEKPSINFHLRACKK